MELLALLAALALLVLVAVMWPRLRKWRVRGGSPDRAVGGDTAWVGLSPVSVEDMMSGQGAADAIASGRISDDALQATIGNAFPHHPETAFAVFVRLRALHCTLDKMVELSLVPGLAEDEPDLLALAASEPVVLIEDRACFDPEQFAKQLQARQQ